MDRQDLMNECDMLRGNIYRMMVTDSHFELMNMFTYAIMRVNEIYWENKQRINMQELQKAQKNASQE